ncbi:MAG: cobalamin biosynthesis protein CobQ [Methylophaga sp.]|nr:MAG: cobalamin biosynthesis protein CobQ [Methylophaga sp.]
MTIWAIANQKGGVGKTTTVVSIAGLLAQQGKPTLILDMDPHGSLTTYFGHDPDTIENSIYSLFQKGGSSPNATLFNSLQKTTIDNLYLLPASTAMATLDRQLGTQGGKGLVIKSNLALLADRFPNILIDCPPMLGVLMINALAACDQLLIPVQTEFLALKGLERMLHTLDMINHARKQGLPYLIVPTMFDRRTRASTQSLRMLREQHNDGVWDGVIPIDTQFRDASKAGIPLPLMNEKSRGSLAYKQLLEHLTSPQHNIEKLPRVF